MGHSKAIEQLKRADCGFNDEFSQDTPYASETGVFPGTSPTSPAALQTLRAKQLEIPLSGNDVHCRTMFPPTAERGSTDTFKTVLVTLTEEITRDKDLLVAKNAVGESSSLAAATPRDIRCFTSIITCLKKHLTSEQVQELIVADNSVRDYLLLLATRAGDIDFFRATVTFLKEHLTSEQLQQLLMAKNLMRETLLLEAAVPGDIDFFTAVIACLKEHLTSEQVGEMVMAKNVHGHHVAVAAARTGNSEFFGTLCSFLSEQYTLEKVQIMLMSKDAHGQIDFSAAAQNCGSDCFTAIMSTATAILSNEQVRELVLTKCIGKTLLRAAFERKDSVSLEAFLQCLKDAEPLEGNQVADELGLHDTFSACAGVSVALGGDLRRVELDILSYLLQNYARPSPEDLMKLSRRECRASDRSFKACCLRAVTFAANPFIPGMFLSMGLADAVARAPEGEKGCLITSQRQVDKLLLEIFERLPQTVRGFHHGMDGCCSVFEPELVRSEDPPPGSLGSLGLALQVRQQRETYCKVPLVMDFLSRRFTRGLPGMRDTYGVLSDPVELQGLREGTGGVDNGLVLNEFLTFAEADIIGSDSGSDPEHEPTFLYGRNSMLVSLMSPRALLQGADSKFPSLTMMPGAQFVVAGLVAKPSNYYRVPAMRMILDFVVYVGILSLFTYAVLFHEDGALTWRDFLVGAYIVAVLIREVSELWKDVSIYFDDRWNVIDVLALAMLAAGLICRVIDSSNPWGHALYALSAPLFYARILFFAQILRFQGPMIEVIFSMTAELVKFGIVMAVVIVGFAVSFHALFRNSDSLGETSLNLFKAMLGEVGFFDEFSGDQEDPVATILLVLYLVIITIMLLNLLVAILSTSHAKVQENVEGEFRVSKACIIQYYRLVVDKHWLPAPFNVVQLVVSLPFTLVDRICGAKTCGRATECVGRLVFWLVLGPLAVVGGALLWMTSALTFTFVWRKHTSDEMAALILLAEEREDLPLVDFLRRQDSGWSRATFMALTHLILGIWCIVGAPLCLCVLWLRPVLLLCFTGWVGGCARAPLTESNRSQQTYPDQTTGWRERENITKSGRTNNLTIEDMLKQAPGGVGVEDLRKYLDDPIVDVEVREDERKRVTTVEHMKLLRNRLEKTLEEAATTMNVRLEHLEKESLENKHKLEAILSVVEGMNSQIVAMSNYSSNKNNGCFEPECV